MTGCPHNIARKRSGISTKGALINHIRASHSTDIHLANIQLCQEVNVHICAQCPCEVFHSAKKLAQHQKNQHPNRRTASNHHLCTQFIQGPVEPNYVPRWDRGLQFIADHLKPDPTTFRSGVAEKIPARLRAEFDDVFIGIVKASNGAANSYVGETILPEWNTDHQTVTWLLFHAEMLILGPKKTMDESIKDCVIRRLNLFKCGHIDELWCELRSVRSWPPQTAPMPDGERLVDKAVQDAVDKDSLSTAYSRAVKPAAICPINWRNEDTLLAKYPRRPQEANNVTEDSLDAILLPQTTVGSGAPLELPGDIIESIKQQNKGRANGLFMNSLDVFIRLAHQDNAETNQAL